MVRPRFSYQSNDPVSTTTGWQFGAPEAGGSGYSYTDNYSDGLRHGYNAGASAVYRAKLGKDGRTITIDGSGSYSDNTNNSNSWSNIQSSSEDRPDVMAGAEGEIPFTWDPAAYLTRRYLRNMAPSSSYSVRGNFTYTEPVAKYAQGEPPVPHVVQFAGARQEVLRDGRRLLDRRTDSRPAVVELLPERLPDAERRPGLPLCEGPQPFHRQRLLPALDARRRGRAR